jgi:uncharacterized BrkB/YihY/UPF0761 family membrane protein
MSDAEDRLPEVAGNRDGAPGAGRSHRMRVRFAAARARAKNARERHVSVAVPFRAAERNRRVASSVLAGGIAYRLFLWLLPFGLILGGAFGLMDADSTEDAAEDAGLPAAVVNAIGDATRAAGSDSWWLLAVGVPLLLYAGYTGAKAVQLIHSLVWDEPPRRSNPLKASLAFTAMVCAFMAAVALTWWIRGETWLGGVLAATLAIAPLAALWLWVSLRLPHRDAPWQALLPGALVVALGFQVLHGLVGNFLVPKLEKSTSLYGGLGATTTLLFFMYIAGSLVVAAPVLNSSLHHELREQGNKARDDGTTSPAEASPG